MPQKTQFQFNKETDMQKLLMLLTLLLLTGCSLFAQPGSYYQVTLPDGTVAEARSTSNSEDVELLYTKNKDGTAVFHFRKTGTDNTDAIESSEALVENVSDAVRDVLVPGVLR